MDECSKLIEYYRKLLEDFKMTMTPELALWIKENYPNEIKIENHIRTILLTHLNMRYG